MNPPKVSITDETITSLAPRVENPAFRALLPKTLVPHRISFKISPVSNAVANAIRRTILCELPVLAMTAEYSDFTTNDEHIIPEMVIKRFRMIPIDQKTPITARFELDAANNTSVTKDIKSSAIRPTTGKTLPFNETFTLFTLKPGRSASIRNITLARAVGFNAGDGMHALAFNASSVAVDQEPLNSYEGRGIPSRESNPRVWEISFNTNGTLPPRAIVALACDNITARLGTVRELVHNIEGNNGEYVLQISGESDTIGNLLMRTVSDLYPEIKGVTYSVSSVSRVVTVRVRCDEDINSIYDAVLSYLEKLFADIKSNFA